MKKTSLPAPLLWPDLIRVFAIIGVVTIHSFILPPLSFASYNFETIFNWLWFITVKTCVPLFLLLSGALLLGKKETDAVFYFKRVRRIVVPWFLWSAVFLITKYADQLSSLPQSLKTFIHILSAEFSFLPALFCLYLLMPFMKVLVQHLKPLKRWQLIGLWFLGISVLPYLRNTLAFPAIVDNGLIRQTINYSGFILLGYELKVWLEPNLNQNKIVSAALFLFVTSVVSTFFIQLTHPSDPPLFLSYVAPLIIISSAAAFCGLFILGQRLQKTQFQKIMHEFSGASFGVFFMHPLIVPHIAFWTQTQDISLRNILISLTTLSLSFLTIFLLQKIPWLKQKIS